MTLLARQQNTTNYPMTFLMVSSTDGVTPVTGLSPTVTLSKNGGAFTSPSGAVSEIGNGWYALAGNATDRNTLGELLLHATGTGAVATDQRYQITVWDPIATNFPSDIANIQGRIPTALVSGRMDSSVGAMANAVLTAAAIASDAITAAKIAADAIGASELAADAVAEIQSGLATASALSADTAALIAELDDISGRIPVSLNGGQMNSHVASMETTIETAIAAAVLNGNLADFVTAGSVGEALLLGRAFGNERIDNTVYNGDGMLTSVRKRIFDTAAHASASTAGGSGETGELVVLNGTAVQASPGLPSTILWVRA